MADIQIFEPGGRAIAYADDHHHKGPAVVLLPGLGLKIGYLGLLAEALAEEDFRVLRVGARSVDAEEPATLHDLAQDVLDVMDHVGLTRAWVGGHEFGGTIARTVSIDHPERVAGVLLLGVEGASPLDVVHVEGSDVPEGARNAALAAMQAAARAATPDIAWNSLAPVIPVLVLQGTEDVVYPVANAEALRETAPERISIVPVEGGMDLFPLTHVAPTAWPIEDYLDWD
ncbi:hypothetical protein GCM10009808_13000 [Microbacterium sediminicola]|uniref:AB hydrolase-1 domain-containing protein n=1 Tax=Microbacterium sediminicola TaxID=415210 RepID=A0ABP4U0U5_9MICO